jgi:hypothetical protein
MSRLSTGPPMTTDLYLLSVDLRPRIEYSFFKRSACRIRFSVGDGYTDPGATPKKPSPMGLPPMMRVPSSYLYSMRLYFLSAGQPNLLSTVQYATIRYCPRSMRWAKGWTHLVCGYAQALRRLPFRSNTSMLYLSAGALQTKLSSESCVRGGV